MAVCLLCSQVGLWGWLGRLSDCLDFGEDMQHDNDAHVNETDQHHSVWLQLESISLLGKECKLVSLVVLRVSLHVRQPCVLVGLLCSGQGTCPSPFSC